MKFIKFTDDAVHPKYLLDLSVKLIEKKIDIIWEAYVILEKDFADPKFCKTLRESGCKWLYFGLESSEPSMNINMNKKHDYNIVEKILYTTAINGIKNHIWFIIGFPGDTKETVERTIEFIEENNYLIHSLEINQFALTKHAPIIQSMNCEKFGIRPLIKQAGDLALTYNYEVLDNSLSQEESKELVINTREYLYKKYNFSNAVRSSNLLTDL